MGLWNIDFNYFKFQGGQAYILMQLPMGVIKHRLRNLLTISKMYIMPHCNLCIVYVVQVSFSQK